MKTKDTFTVKLAFPESEVWSFLDGDYGRGWTYWGAVSERQDDDSYRVVEVLEDGEHIEYRLDRKKIEKGLELLAYVSPKHFAEVLCGGLADANTADALVQCCVFGQLKYG